MVYYIIKQTIKAIEHGLEDERITTEYQQKKSANVFWNIVIKTMTIIILVVVFAVFSISVFIQVSGDKNKGNIPVPKVVLSSSMAYKHASNKYLIENNLNNQFNMFDLIFTEKLPDEFELELYDVVVYEYQDQLIIHRIVGIEEPNEDHPGERYFLLRGDSSKYADEFPVSYEQMRAIYTGKRIRFVGSFFAFMQSPAGYLCILLVIFAVVATPVAEKKLLKAKTERLIKIGVIKENESNFDAEVKRDEE